MNNAPDQSTGALPSPEWIVQMERITKRFPGVVANQEVELRVRPATFHAVIGENGAGKSTLLNILYGRYRPDSGRLFVAAEEVTDRLHSPADAIGRGIGLVSQHYALIPALTVLENLMLGAENPAPGGLLRHRAAADEITALAGRLGLPDLDLNLRADRLSIAAGQKVEILKALYRGARILLLDEPTATLAPQEVDSLFALLHTLAEKGTTIVFVTHKLREVMQHSEAVTVMRAGRSVAVFETAQTDPQALLREMIGPRAVSSEEAVSSYSTIPSSKQSAETRAFPDSQNSEAASPLLQVTGLSIAGIRQGAKIGPIDLSIGAGEIVGIAGVDGSGQREFSEAIVGLRRSETGVLTLNGQDLTQARVGMRATAGIAYIPEDRHRAGMVMEFSLAENYLLGHEGNPAWGGGLFLNARRMAARTAEMLRRYDVRLGDRGAEAVARTLSGGNQQKVVVARAVESEPRLLVACQPTRGLDVSATQSVYKILRKTRAAGAAILLFSLDLDEIFELSDRIAVMFNGRIVGILPRAEATPEAVGALMTGAGRGEERNDG